MKKVLFGFTVLLLSIGLVACGNSEEKANTTDKENEIEVTEETEETEPSEPEAEEESLEVIENPGEAEFVEYLNRVRPILADDIGEFAAYYEELRQQSANGEIDDYTFAELILTELLPTGHQIQQDLEAIFPSKELRETHEILIDMMAIQNQAFTEIVEAVNAGDYSRITSANELLSEARQLERDYIYDLKDHAANFGVEF
jgi:hypothetical protein